MERGGSKDVGEYKVFWKGCADGVAGVGVLVAKRWIEKVISVNRVSERLLVLQTRVGRTVLNLVIVYAPQVGRTMDEKEEFLILLGKTVSAVDAAEQLVVCGDLNGHVGAKSDGFGGVHGGFGFGERNVEGEMLMEMAGGLNLAIINTWFKKAEGKLVTYESGGCKSVVDYIMVRKAERHHVRNVTVLPGEACMQQHKLLVCMLQIVDCKKVTRQPTSFVSRCKVWKLKEPDIRQAFQDKMMDGFDGRSAEGSVDDVWGGLRDCLLEVAGEVCGKTKGIRRHKETWWWNDEVAEVIREKQRLYKIYNKSRKGADKKKVADDKKKYEEVKRAAKTEVSKAQETARKRFGEELDEEDRNGGVFRAAKQIVKSNRDIVGGGCVKDTSGKIIVDDDQLLETWRAHYEKLANEEFPWNRDTLQSVEPVCGPCERISTEEVRSAIKKMKNNKAAGPSGVVADMLKAAGDVGTLWVTEVCNHIVMEGRIPADWCSSWMVNVYKGKGDALECGSYRGIKLLEHVLKVFERVIEERVRRIVKIDDMQFGFMAGKGTTDAIFIVRQLQEKYLASKKDLWMAFIDLEKAFDRVPREVVWWALRTLGVDEWIVTVIKAMYFDASTMVKLNGRTGHGFNVRVGVHQGSVLSPLLFILVMEALSRTFRDGLPMELLYADDLVLLADSEELLVEKIMRWKAGLEAKGLRVNMGKTKVMRCREGTGKDFKTGKYPCGVCSKGVGSNSIKCTSCGAWVHKRCSGITGKLCKAREFKCKKCTNGAHVQSSGPAVISLGMDQKLECVGAFRYLGDTIGVGGGAEDASRARVRCAWAKFRELAPILASRGASLRVKGKIYRACVQRVLVYGSETWPMKSEDLLRLERAERMMWRWMCGVKLEDRRPSTELCKCLDVEPVADVVRRGRLRWFGHVERKSGKDWVSA